MAKNERRRFWSAAVPSFLLSLGLVLSGCAGWQEGRETGTDEGLELVILHTNDVHSYLAGVDKYGNACFEEEGCRGGFGRVAAAIHKAKAEQDNVLALDAGDQFQGTLFYSVNKWPMIADINRFMPYDAMTLGNHEWDEGCLQLAEFLEEASFPILAANLKPEKGCPLLKSEVPSYIIKEIRGVPVAIVGLANDEVQELAAACPHTLFENDVATMRRIIDEVEKKGVHHVVAVTHLGLSRDRELARAVDGLDIIVGGHSHSYIGPDSEEGPYPIVEKSPSGQNVLVVTAKRAALYLGELTVHFDAEGYPVSWSGGPHELMPEEASDPDVSRLIRHYADTLAAYSSKVVGAQYNEFADGMDACREGECLGGMIVTDSMLDFARPFGADIALCNGGGIRASMPVGQLTLGDLLAIMPFGNMLVVREYSGEEIWEALEHGVSTETGQGPRLLQVAGLRYDVDASLPVGSRIVKAEVIDGEGRAEALDLKKRYGVILSDYMAHGGDGYAMLKGGKVLPSGDPMDVSILEDYLRKNNPLPMPVTGRINWK